MRKIIDGKRYDTETATEVASWSNDFYPNDFHYCEETLYRTSKGAFFVCGDGGPLSKYSEPCGNNGRSSGSDLFPISAEEAMRWLEEKGFTGELEELFPNRIQDA